MKVVDTKTTTLEGETNRGEFHFHSVEVKDDIFDEVVQFASQYIKNSWYFHLVKNNELLVMFQNLVFKAYKGNAEEFKRIREYALSQGIHPNQLPLERLIENPYL